MEWSSADVTEMPSTLSPLEDLNATAAASMDLFNSSFHEMVNSTAAAGGGAGGSLGALIAAVYVAGIAGNAAAVVALRRGQRRVRNRKHLLLLTALAVNDLLALVGMLCAMVVAQRVAGARGSRWYCGARVLLRTFGVGSVCIAVTMASERYLALTRPFYYQKKVTYDVIRWALVGAWAAAAALTWAPLLGLGRYYDAPRALCVRYREALPLEPWDFGYAVFYVLCGLLLCVGLVYCNLAVIRALYAISAPGAHGAPLVRRVSRTSCRQRERRAPPAGGGPAPAHHNAATAEEVAFSRLMATLSVLFMICWLPQMVSSALYLGLGPAHWRRLEPLARLADLLMLLNYVLDPVLYVLMRRRQPIAALCHSVARCFKRGHKTSTESVSMKTSCCAPETLVVSDSSQGEGRPLRALADLPLPPPVPPTPPTATLLKIGH